MPKLLRTVTNILDGKPTGTRGQSLVELTLTIPILLIMILGMTEIAFLANNYLTLMDATREAARFGVTRNPTTWPVGEARNFQRMDCDTDSATYNMFKDRNIGTNGERDLGDPRGAQLALLSSNAYVDSYSSGAEATLSYFDAVTCHALSLMAPLKFDDSPISKDDIVVSVVSFATLNYNTVINPSGPNINVIGERGPKANDLFDVGLGPKPMKPDDTYSQYNSYFYTAVTGRWPLENRMCGSNASTVDPMKYDVRDPFDWLRPDWSSSYMTRNPALQNAPDLKVTTFGGRNPDGSSRSDETELGFAAPGLTFEKEQKLLNSTDSQQVRGFTWAGKLMGADDCYGSQFTVSRLEDLLNDTDFSRSNLKSSTGNGGLVIVEVQWQHHPFFLGAIFTRNGTSENDPLLNIYAMFPVPQAEPTATPRPRIS